MVLMHSIFLYISVTFLQVNCTVWSFTWFFSQNLVKFILKSWLSAHDYILISSWQQWTYNNYILCSISFNKMYICIYFKPLLEFFFFFCEFGGFLWKIYNSSGSQRVKHHIKFHPDQLKVCKKMKPRGFALRWPCDPQPRSWSVQLKAVSNSRSQRCL